MPVTCTDSTITTITQASPTLAIGNAVYLSASKVYTPALATSLGTSQVVGFIVAAGVGPNQWVLQTEGYNIGGITVDDTGAALVPASIYYLTTNPAKAGSISLTNPILTNTWSKPLYISEQIAGVGTVNAGYILNQRPINFESIVAYDQAFAMALLFGR